MKIAKRLIAVTAMILLITLTSCSMKQDVYIERTGGGRVSFDITLASYLTDVIDQVVFLLEPEEPLPDSDESFFDLKAIEEDFRKRDGVELIRLEAPNKNRLSGEFSFDDINLLLQDVKEESAESRLLRLETRGDATELTVNITRESVEALLEENPSINNPLVENFGPTTTEGLSDQDYLDMMEFALGEESRMGIQDSSLSLTIRVDGRIVDQKGGRLIDDRTVIYSIPVLPLLMLKEPLEYYLRYQ